MKKLVLAAVVGGVCWGMGLTAQAAPSPAAEPQVTSAKYQPAPRRTRRSFSYAPSNGAYYFRSSGRGWSKPNYLYPKTDIRRYR